MFSLRIESNVRVTAMKSPSRLSRSSAAWHRIAQDMMGRRHLSLCAIYIICVALYHACIEPCHVCQLQARQKLRRTLKACHPEAPLKPYFNGARVQGGVCLLRVCEAQKLQGFHSHGPPVLCLVPILPKLRKQLIQPVLVLMMQRHILREQRLQISCRCHQSLERCRSLCKCSASLSGWSQPAHDARYATPCICPEASLVKSLNHMMC